MKTLISTIILLSSVSAFANCPEFKVPKKFMARESLFSSRATDMTFDAGGNRIAKIEERLLSATTTFDLYDNKRQKIATARQRMFSGGTEIEIKDCAGKMIGKIKERVFHNMFDIYSKYSILDASGAVVAESEKKEILAPSFSVTGTNGKQLMKMRLSTFSTRSLDEWVVEILNDTQADPRILLMIPAFKTSADNRETEK